MAENKRILVTGAAGNLGRAVVNHLLDHQYQVVGTKLPHESWGALAGRANFEGTDLDVTDEAAVKAFVQQHTGNGKEIEGAALLVGGFAMGGITDTAEEDLLKMYRLNFLSAFFLVKELLEYMTLRQEGRFVMVGARPALDPAAGKDLTAYALSKSLVFTLAEQINAVGKNNNVVASVIVPSIIDTPPNREGMPDADFDKWVTPEEIAANVGHLFSEAGAILREPVMKVYGKS